MTKASLPELRALAGALETLEWAADVLTGPAGELELGRVEDVRRVCRDSVRESRDRLLDGFAVGRFSRRR